MLQQNVIAEYRKAFKCRSSFIHNILNNYMSNAEDT
jgi:hypothetical protein